MYKQIKYTIRKTRVKENVWLLTRDFTVFSIKYAISSFLEAEKYKNYFNI